MVCGVWKTKPSGSIEGRIMVDQPVFHNRTAAMFPPLRITEYYSLVLPTVRVTPQLAPPGKFKSYHIQHHIVY